MNQVRKFLTEYLKLTDEHLIGKLEECAMLRKVEKGELIFQSGCKLTRLVFLLNGIYRTYSDVDYDGKEETDFLDIEYGTALIPCYGLKKSAAWNIIALADGEILLFPISVLIKLADKYPELLYLYGDILQECMEKFGEHRNALMRKDGIGRYEWFVANYPELLDKVNNSYIASFLGMSPVTLSRMRSSVRNLNIKKERGENDGLF